MRKLGGVAFIMVGVVLIVLAALRALGVLTIFLNNETSAYGVGFLAGTAVFLILLSFLGIKAFKKGRGMLKPSEN
ncbi:MAG: hypothetical protein COW18_03755 [Zetaproteobacteria bacterium CG12_big_fil_rev_8_21_14_0_65_54_13]|nr:MAG: hypothetical protein COX55_02515 [Zetaproteobacteria bacterium CG23_combo_of_CG06-09_8_20_14_all_54_7]PIW50292.1 MAG: hypothetical protein COW18_03755 [Zetaproteobacteria bacterium CG12_big_fil_rev_8_21_14_0_65_54_13]PIX53261.1 MAG: hypothetical protein COZ50_14115 [Zetaproteobacteria bacterium CG_4_10_14_3_um_filter_54_28]PJA31021.1 MAG: hypothetical protein CO188_01065 [Zetaproteobacteria bacterium CG_4_9_14_3_um_filter_54_145]